MPKAIPARLASGDADVSQLMKPFDRSQPPISDNLTVVERAGLVRRGRDAQRKDAADWMEPFREFWELKFSSPDRYKCEKPRYRRTLNRVDVPNNKVAVDEIRRGFDVTLPADNEILMTRTFDAPPAVIFEAWTKAEHVRRWWDPSGVPLATRQIDLRPGGSFRWVNSAHGVEHAFTRVYREITPPEMPVFTVKIFPSSETRSQRWCSARRESP